MDSIRIDIITIFNLLFYTENTNLRLFRICFKITASRYFAYFSDQPCEIYETLQSVKNPIRLFLNVTGNNVKEPNWFFHKLTKLQYLFGYFTQFVNSGNSHRCKFAYLPPARISIKLHPSNSLQFKL